MNKKIDINLINYIENNIFPLYERNEEGHGINHIKYVIKRSINIALDYDVDMNLVYVIAAYHDIGNYIDRKNHEIISANMFMEDEYLKNYFNDEERIIIKEAIIDHRASNKHEPRSIYGKIVSTADRAIVNIESIILRAYSYGIKNYPELSKDEQIKRIYEHLINKYGVNGYSKIYLKDQEYTDSINKLRDALSNKQAFMNNVSLVIDKKISKDKQKIK